jgi:ribosomal protein L17
MNDEITIETTVEIDLSHLVPYLPPENLVIFGAPTLDQLKYLVNSSSMLHVLVTDEYIASAIKTANNIRRYVDAFVAQNRSKRYKVYYSLSITILPLKFCRNEAKDILEKVTHDLDTWWNAPAGYSRGSRREG